jgi:hypothetical protein
MDDFSFFLSRDLSSSISLNGVKIGLGKLPPQRIPDRGGSQMSPTP